MSAFGARTLGVIASLVFACASMGCAERSGGLRFAMSTSDASPAPIRVGGLHVLDERVNLQEPIMMDVAGNDVTVTFAMRQRNGVTVAVDPMTLESRVANATTYPERVKSSSPPYLSPATVTVALARGTMTIWSDEASGRVYAQTFDTSGAPRGEPLPVSPADMDVVGAPRAATADGKHVVVAFFASRLDGFQIVAASLEPML
jgi:hypothetical protein